MGWINKNSGLKQYQTGGEITPSMSVSDTPMIERRTFDWDKKKKRKRRK